MRDIPGLIEPLSNAHGAARREFVSGVPELDTYIREQAGQHSRARVAVTYVLTDGGRRIILGYYTLSGIGVSLPDLPEPLQRRLPRYPILPATLIGRLAVDERHRGKGLGEFLLMDALRRSFENSRVVGSMAVIVDARDSKAREFYLRYGFIAFRDRPNRLFLPMATIAGLFE